MWPPVGSPLKSKLMSMYFPNRLELSFRFVLALPNASMIWFDLIKTVVTLNTVSGMGGRSRREEGEEGKKERERVRKSEGVCVCERERERERER